MASDTNVLKGTVLVELFDKDGNLKEEFLINNLITDAGDLYYVAQGISGVSPANPADPTKVDGMKLGTGTTAVAKNGAGSALVTYLSGTNVAFDTTFSQSANLGAGAGVQAVYKTTFVAGVGTHSALAEVVIINDQASNATSSAANTISRVLFPSTINKGASDTLAVTWNHKFLGA